MMDPFNYREVIPDLSSLDEWNEITLNTGATQSTLQDIKVAEKAGGYCYQNAESHQTRNRFIYWRSNQDVLELSEISLDFNLYQNNLRYKFTDSPVITVSITEQERHVTLLVATVCSLHCINFPHPNVLGDGNVGSQTGSAPLATENSVVSSAGSSQSFSIFRDASSTTISKQNVFHVIDSSSGNLLPHTAASYLSPNGEEAYFALACQSQSMLYVMSTESGQAVSHQLKEHNIMPRLFSNLKGALIGKSEASDAEFVTSLTFSMINGQILLVALYRNDVLRLWSTSSLHCVSSLNCVREQQRTQGPQANSLRKIDDNNLCVFLSHSTGAEFVCIEIHTDVGNSTGFSLFHRRVISAPHLDLTDFEVSDNRIWALWSNAEGEFSISNFLLVRGAGGSMQQWMSALMEPPPDRYCVGVEHGIDPREAYCSYIFHPGKFERNVISKALLMFRRTNVRFEAKHCNMSLLKDHVCQVIEDELLNEFKDCDATDEEYFETATRLWERFYSGCEQYHMKACQPTGLVILKPLDGVCIVKKSTFSLLRPCETLENLMLAGDDIDVAAIVPTYFPENEQAAEDMINLIGVIAQIEKWLSEDVKLELDKKLYQLEMPSVLFAKLVNEILSGEPDTEILPRNFLIEIRQRLQSISDLSAAIALLLDNLRMDNGVPEAMQTNLAVEKSSRFLFNIGVLFGSTVGLSVLSETVRQNAMIRFAICRNLLILQQILVETYLLPIDMLEKMRADFMSHAVVFLQSYHVMAWISETPVNLSSVASSDTAIQRLNILQLTNGSGRIFTMSGKTHAAPLLRVFLNAKGLYTALALYAENNDTSPAWRNTLMMLTTIVSQLIWPISYNFTFGEWLFGTCQHILIEDYVRLLNSWCAWNVCSRQFILAVSLLDCGEAHKAYDLFLQSAKGVLQEHFLNTKILKNTPLAQRLEQLSLIEDCTEESMHLSNQATAQFYLKVIQLFEQHNALDYIISLALVAIGLLEDDDPQLPMFQSIVFNNHLQLEHYEEAYHALIYNAESSRRKDCLRQLVTTLFTSKRLNVLMHFPYAGLRDEFENIVETRARSLTIEDNEIYDFLYAFHVNNENMRKASAAMYEQAMRLQLETDTLSAMEKRCACLVACINALHLIDPRYRWIAKPVIGDDYKSVAGSEGSGERNGDLNNDLNDLIMDTQDNTRTGDFIKQQVVVLEIKDIRRELLHTEALVRLASNRKDVHSYLNAGPQELSVILASCGMFTDALKLAKGFNVTMLPVFDSLTSACVRAAYENTDETWSWLEENDLADISQRKNPADMAWALLEKLVEENEEDGSTLIRKSVVNKLLSLSAFVPQWLHNSYKLANCDELLLLYVTHSRLIEAADFAQEMLNAMLGLGSEYFSFKHPITVTNPEMCLPVGKLDLLLHALTLNAEEDIEYKQALTDLQELLQKYVQTALRTANDKMHLTARRV